MTRRVEVVAIGDELVHGHIVDTNSPWLSRELALQGCEVRRVSVVGDGEDELVDALRAACARSDLVIATGGLGPTADDRTRGAVARVVQQELVFDADAWRSIEAVFRSFGRLSGSPLPQSNRSQATFPAGARVLPNEWGTAPGFVVAVDGAELYSLPGVPAEMRQMFAHAVRPELEGRGLRAMASHTLQVIGTSEAALGERISEFMVDGREPRVGITALGGQLTVRVAGFDADAVAETVGDLRPRLGELLVYEGDHSLADEVGSRLIELGVTVAVAESCTGGLVGAALTEVPGISAVFLAGFVTYACAAKVRDLGVPDSLLAAHGAVSTEVAQSMAAGAARRAGARAAVAVTGIAGPGGGTASKPVGTVCFAVIVDGQTTAIERHLPDLGRDFLRQRSVREALLMLLRALPPNCPSGG